MSATQLEEETGLAATRVRMILMNPLYNGWIRRHRGKNETRRPAPWRATPPVSDELWARVEEIRRAKTRGGGPKNWDRVDLLGGLLVCVCGRQLRNDGTFADGRHRKLHANPFEAWGRKARLGDQTWEGPVLTQVAGIALDDVTLASVVAALGSNQQPVAIDRARIAVLLAGSEKAAAHRLGLSNSTVKHHLANARTKMGAETTAQLVWILAPRLPEPEGTSRTEE